MDLVEGTAALVGVRTWDAGANFELVLPAVVQRRSKHTRAWTCSGRVGVQHWSPAKVSHCLCSICMCTPIGHVIVGCSSHKALRRNAPSQVSLLTSGG
jgi:hypothetical protein